MYLKILPGESQLRKMIKSVGGSWNHEKKLWELAYQEVEMLGLGHRIIDDKRRN